MRLRGRIDGLARFRGALDAIARGGSITDDIAATAEDIRERAAANLREGAPRPQPAFGEIDASAPADERGDPVDALAQSLAVRPSGDGGYTVSTALDHGWHLEFGSHARPAAPWLAPAAEDARPALLARIRNRLNATASAALRRAR